jgi:hypothetical protein
MKKTLLAIDPGMSGGVAWMKDDTVCAVKMPVDPFDMLDLFREIQKGEKVSAALEKVGNHVHGNSASSSVKLSRNVGHLEMGLMALAISHRQVLPTKWMKHVVPGRPKGLDPKTVRDRKNYIKLEMQRRYPHLRVTLCTADALGILTWLYDEEARHDG